MPRAWKEEPEHVRRVWKEWRRRQEGATFEQIGKEMGVSMLTVQRDIARLKEAVGAKELHPAMKELIPTVKKLAEVVMGLFEQLVDSLEKPESWERRYALAGGIQHICRSLDAVLGIGQDGEVQETLKELAPELAGVDQQVNPVASYIDDVRRLVQGSNAIDDAIFGKDSGRS